MRRHLASAPAFSFALLLCVLAVPLFAQQTVAARGRVVDGEGNPVPGVKVLLDYRGHVVQKYRTKTDKNGEFIHLNVYEGQYQVTLSKDDVGEVSFPFAVRELASTEKPPDLRFSPRPAPPPPPPGSGLAPAAEVPGAAPADAQLDFTQIAADINAATALSREGHEDEAIAAYEAILAQAPNIPLVHYRMAESQKKKGDAAAAGAGYRRSIELDPKFVDGYVGLATVLAESGKGDEAVAAIRSGVAEDETSGRLRYALGVLEMHAGHNREAREALLKAAELDPENFETQYHLGTLALNMGDTAEAVSRFRQFIEAAPADASNVDLARSLIGALQK